MSDLVLEARRVEVRYPGGVLALRGVDLDVSLAETVALVGESGSGKSTLLKTFNRLVTPTRGEVLFEGVALDASPPEQLRRQIGYVQQEGGLLPHWTVQRNVALVPRLLGWSTERVESRTRELLELVGLSPDEFGPRHPRSLSGGQRQRVAFARALAAQPQVILLDEPFGALDPIRRHEMQNEFLRWKQELATTSVLVTHDLHEAMRLADRIAVMENGIIHQLAPPQDLVTAPANDYVSTLIQRSGAA